MSAIGSYVHYHALNYIEHGTSVKGIYRGYKSQKQRIQSQLKRFSTLAKQNTDIAAVEEIANVMLKLSDTTTLNRNATPLATAEEYYRDFQDIFMDSVEMIFRDSEFQQIGDTTHQALNFDVPPSELYMLDVSNINTTIDYVKRLNKLIIQEIESGITEAKNILKWGQDFLFYLNIAQKSYQEFLESASSVKKQRIGTGKNASREIASGSKEVSKRAWAEVYHYIVNLKAVHDTVTRMPWDYAIAVKALSQAKSLFPAMLNATINDMVQQAARSTLNNVKMNNVAEIKESFLQKAQNVTLQTIADDRNLTFNLAWHENNLVDFVFQKPSSLRKGRIFQSNQYKTEMDLITLLQSQLCGNDFINHFLNIFAQRQDSSSPLIILKARNQMLEELQLIGLYALIRSNNLSALRKNKKIDIIFYQDKEGGKVKAKNIYSILDGLEQNANAVNLYMDNKSIKDGFYPLLFNKYWGDWQVPSYPDAWKRISALLADAHRRKISITLNI